MLGFVSVNISTWLIFFFVFGLTYYFVWRSRQYRNLPPGPTPYPFVGNFHHFIGKNIWKTLRSFRRKYGDIYSVQIFDKILIIICRHENIKDAFVKHANDFSFRPILPSEGFKGQGLILASGKIWKHNRRFTVHTLKDFGMGKNKLQFRIHEEISHFLDAIEEHRGQPFDIKNLLNIAVSNIICSIVFGKRFDYHDNDFLSYVHKLDKLVTAGNFSKPGWLRHIPGDPLGMKKTYQYAMDLQGFYQRQIREHFNAFDENNVEDLIDAYIKQMKKGAEESLMNPDELERVTHDLFLAGTETATTSLRFGLLFLLQNPDIHTRLSADLEKHVPLNRLPDLSDKPNLPYVEATIFEILRLSSIASFAAPHSSIVDIQYKGYTIPKSAIILPDLKSVLMDEVLWNDPEAFNPSRFLDENMAIFNTDNLIPFSVGPRVCLGEALAKMELYLFLSAMLQRFKFLPPEGEDPPKLEVVHGGVCSPKPFRLRAVKK